MSKGTRWVSSSRDWYYKDTDGENYALDQPTPNALGGFYIYINGTCDSDTSAQAKLPCFGTNFISRGYDAENRHRLYVNDSAKSRTDMTGAYQASGTRLAANEVLGVNTFQSHGTTGQNHNFNGCEIVTPIHTSSHYQPFETPYLKELVGGDRNMEQTNLVVTSDGKTWDEVTRDTSYIGNVCLSATTDTNESSDDAIMVMDEWRGVDTTKNYYNKDFAIAYDRVVCLVDGHYEIHVQTISQGAGTNGRHGTIKINGTLVLSGHTGQSNLTSSVSDLNILLKRGDYIQVTGKWYGGSGGIYDVYQIKRIN